MFFFFITILFSIGNIRDAILFENNHFDLELKNIWIHSYETAITYSVVIS